MGQVKKSEGTKARDEISATFFLFYIYNKEQTQNRKESQKKLNLRITQCRSFDTGILFLQPEPLGNKNDQ